jgi:hypothetical protein
MNNELYFVMDKKTNAVEKKHDCACPDGIPKILYGIPFLKTNRFPCFSANANCFGSSDGLGCCNNPFKIKFKRVFRTIPIP